jgi:alkyl hydroperoxide reductase subunit AhpC
LQTKYSDKLRVIGISVDGNEKIPAWRSIIKSKQLTWKQYLDMGGLLAKQMGINSYPSNFLVDANGVIVARNLEVEEIESFLAE